ncbi:hypothetical protein AKH00_15695 [Microbacterium sp. GCS4]|nr:hypothetical protein AKH00_15695 [Microbacterium sp. GCS4]
MTETTDAPLPTRRSARTAPWLRLSLSLSLSRVGVRHRDGRAHLARGRPVRPARLPRGVPGPAELFRRQSRGQRADHDPRRRRRLRRDASRRRAPRDTTSRDDRRCRPPRCRAVRRLRGGRLVTRLPALTTAHKQHQATTRPASRVSPPRNLKNRPNPARVIPLQAPRNPPNPFSWLGSRTGIPEDWWERRGVAPGRPPEGASTY